MFTPYGVNYAMAWVPLALVSFYAFNSYMPLQRWSSLYCIAVDGFPAFFCALLWLLSLSCYCLCWPLACLPFWKIYIYLPFITILIFLFILKIFLFRNKGVLLKDLIFIICSFTILFNRRIDKVIVF